MKKIIKFLSILIAIFVFINCSEDIYLHNGEDGKIGAQGPKGDKGDPAQVELSFVPVPATLAECSSGGYKTDIYVNGVLNTTLPAVCNGQSFDISDLNLRTDLLSLDELCKIRVSYVNDKEFSRDTLCNGETGGSYVPVYSTKSIQLNELCKIREVYIDGNFLYADTTCDGENGEIGPQGPSGEPGDTIIKVLPGDTVVITNNIIAILSSEFYENCDKGDSHFYQNELGWTLLGTASSINHNDSPNGHGSLESGDNDTTKTKSIAWGPDLTSSKYWGKAQNLYNFWFYAGSRLSSELEVWVLFENGDSTKVKSGSIKTTPNFTWYHHYDDATWSSDNIFLFQEDDLLNPSFPNVIKIGTRSKNTSTENIHDRNDKVIMDEFHARGYELVVKI